MPLLFLYRDVLGVELLFVDGVVRAKRPARLPVVFTRDEVAGLLYGSGLRLMEALRLRVKDLDFEYMEILVRDGKGEKDRRPVLPGPLADPLRHQLERVRLLHEQDLREGLGEVYLPYALARKYPSAAKEWAWQYVFPSAKLSVDLRSGAARRHHASADSVQREVKRALPAAGIAKHGGCHTLRHSFATHLLRRRLRPADDTGASGALGRADDADLHTRPEQGRERHQEPAREAGGGPWLPSEAKTKASLVPTTEG